MLSDFDKTHLDEVWEECGRMNDEGEVVEEIIITDEELASITTNCVLGKLYESDFR